MIVKGRNTGTKYEVRVKTYSEPCKTWGHVRYVAVVQVRMGSLWVELPDMLCVSKRVLVSNEDAKRRERRRVGQRLRRRIKREGLWD